MRTTTTTCLAILLFAALASARLGDPADTLLGAANPTTTPSAADVDTFLSGVWDTIGLGRDFDDFSTCIQEDDNAGTQLQKSMDLMNSSSAIDIIKGLNKLAKVTLPMIRGLKACNMKDKYTSTITKIVKSFTDPEKLNLDTGASLSVNGVDVYSEVIAAITACNSGQFAVCGASIGGAMGKAFYGQTNVTSAEQVAKINAIPDITWTAGVNDELSKMNLWQFKKNRITLRKKKNKKAATSDDADESDEARRNLATIPAAFDSRTNWPTCIQAIRNQGNCGSCWAFSASEVLSDRFCIKSNKTINTVMSPQYLVSCDTVESACNGGYLTWAWYFLETTGDVSDTCFPYQSSNGFVPACSTFSKCSDGTKLRKYYAKVNSTKLFTTPATIQAEIQANGPVEASMAVYSDLGSYVSGIYTNTTGSTFLGGHAVKIVGWGKANSTNYWIVANSWGQYWGESGYFRIKFGSSYIDTYAIAGLPDLTRS